jgi:hypothetical protein
VRVEIVALALLALGTVAVSRSQAETFTGEQAIYEKGWRDGAEVSCLAQLQVLAAAKRAAYKDAEPEVRARGEREAQLFDDMKKDCGEHTDWLWRKMQESSR